MLEGLELDSVFRHAQTLGWKYVEAFIDATLTASYRIQNRLETVEFHQSGGIALRCTNDTQSKVFLLPHTDVEGMIAALNGASPGSSGIDGAGFVFKMTPTETAANKSRLQQWFRAAFGESESTLKASVAMNHILHRFIFANSDGQANEDYRERADLEVSWHSAPNSTVSKWEKRSYSVRQILDELKCASVLKDAVKLSRTKVTYWPAPEGALPVCFSAKAVSKFLQPIVSHFESDRVLADNSFLNRWPEELSLAFDLEETSHELPGSASDAEATLHRSFFLFRDGKPCGLASSKRTAELMGAEPTGHVVRTSFRYPGIIAIRRVSLIPKHAPANPPQGLERGLLIQDLEAAISLGSVPRIHLGVRVAHLIHHGQAGEAVEPFHIECPLAEFLSAFQSGGIDAETFGLPVHKLGQEVLLEVHTPALMAPHFPVPGKVPASNYW